MNILVTGSAGFIGSHLCERLVHQGHRVWALDIAYPTFVPSPSSNKFLTKANNIHFIYADITNLQMLRNIFTSHKFDQVIHLAALAGVRQSLTQPSRYQHVNVEGTSNVFQAASEAGVKKFIIASSSSVYGISSQPPFHERMHASFVLSPYAATKVACEALGHSFHHLYDLDVVMLRFFTVYGPRQRNSLAIHKFTRLMAAGRPIPVYGDGSSSRDYTYISDIIEGILLCTQREFGFEILNLGCANPTKLTDLISLIEDSLGIKAIIDYRPVQKGDVPSTCADISRARDSIGYNPKIMITNGIPLFVEWFLRSGDVI